jgi:hypothetical protein
MQVNLEWAREAAMAYVMMTHPGIASSDCCRPDASWAEGQGIMPFEVAYVMVTHDDGASGVCVCVCVCVQAPFELRALEVVLDFVTLLLEFLVSELEKAVHPVLDAIVNKARDPRHADS